MNLTGDLDLASTRRKLADLESQYEELKTSDEDNEHIRELTMQSLSRLINQFKEEIVRYEVADRS